MNSILQDEKRCWVCWSTQNLESHHCFNNNPNRKLSEKYGLKVWLCREHHTGNTGVHLNQDLDNELKAYAQKTAMVHYGWSKEDFIRKFGKNYL